MPARLNMGGYLIKEDITLKYGEYVPKEGKWITAEGPTLRKGDVVIPSHREYKQTMFVWLKRKPYVPELGQLAEEHHIYWNPLEWGDYIKITDDELVRIVNG